MSALGKSIESVLKNTKMTSYLPFDEFNIPVEPARFCHDFGPPLPKADSTTL